MHRLHARPTVRSGREGEGLVQILRRGAVPAGLLCVVLAMTTGPIISAAGNELRIEAPAATVGPHARFFVRLVLETQVATSGAQATLTFDPSRVQVTSVVPRGPYASAQLFLGGTDAAIDVANDSGRLSTVAAAFLPPGAVPPGTSEFLEVGLRAVGCGPVELGLPVGPADAALIAGTDAAYGEQIPVDATNGAVTIDCGAGGAATAGAVAPDNASATEPETIPATLDSSNGGPPWALLGLGLAALALLAGGWWLMRSRA